MPLTFAGSVAGTWSNERRAADADVDLLRFRIHGPRGGVYRMGELGPDGRVIRHLDLRIFEVPSEMQPNPFLVLQVELGEEHASEKAAERGDPIALTLRSGLATRSASFFLGFRAPAGTSAPEALCLVAPVSGLDVATAGDDVVVAPARSVLDALRGVLVELGLDEQALGETDLDEALRKADEAGQCFRRVSR